MHLFNVFEEQKGNSVITARILRETSVTEEPYFIRFEIDETRRVTKAYCSCVAGGQGGCKHSAALFLYINTERTEGKTDWKQGWTAPSKKLQETYPKGQTLQQIFGEKGPTQRRVVVQKSQDDENLVSLAKKLEKCGLTSSSLYKSLTIQTSDIEDEVMAEIPDFPDDIIKLFSTGTPADKMPDMSKAGITVGVTPYSGDQFRGL